MRVGLLGGSFDPVHAGHLEMARAACHLLGLDRVLFVVARQPPHKRSCRADPWHRYAMVVLALRTDAHLAASGLELNRQGPSYTVDTLGEMRSRRPADQFCFLMGADSWSELPQWHDYAKLRSENCLAWFPRPGVKLNLEGRPQSREVNSQKAPVSDGRDLPLQPGTVYLVNHPVPDISSTEIREAFRRRSPVSDDVVPSVVAEYIQKYGVYE